MTAGIPTTARQAADLQLTQAHLEIRRPEGLAPIPLRFNPAELTIRKTSNFAEIGIPGLDAPLLQWVRGGLEILSFDAMADTSDTGRNVHTEYVGPVRNLLDFDTTLHAPPIVAFVWGHSPFQGVLDGLSTTYLLFDRAGIPLRAKMSISIKGFRSARDQATKPKSSPDVDKLYVTRRGDTLRSIAFRVYRDPAAWRVLAAANGLDGSDVAPGRRLRIPRLR